MNLTNKTIRFLAQVFIFIVLTGLMLGGHIVPYRPGGPYQPELQRIVEGALKGFWWLAAAWLTTGFLRAFVVLGRKPNESKLLQDLLSAIVYMACTFAIIADVLDLPVKGLLATSGALAIILGLALQSSLGDVFSGLVLNLERPYHVGDWIGLDDAVEGRVMETNWRATHILTSHQDLAVIPNSVVAKARITNFYAPTRAHAASVRIKLDPAVGAARGCDLLRHVLLGSTQIVRSPAPTVVIKDVSAEMIDFELGYVVNDFDSADAVQSELFDRIFKAVNAAGIKFASRLPFLVDTAPVMSSEAGVPDRLVAGVSVFGTLSGEEKAALAAKMERKVYQPGQIVVTSGTVVQALTIVAYGVLVATEDDEAGAVERLRLSPGTYFGEMGLLTGTPISGQITALTKVVVYEVSKEAILPLLKARPRMAEELSTLLASRLLARQTVLEEAHANPTHEAGFAMRALADIKRLFVLE